MECSENSLHHEASESHRQVIIFVQGPTSRWQSGESLILKYKVHLATPHHGENNSWKQVT